MTSLVRQTWLGVVLMMVAPAVVSAQAEDVGHFRIGGYFALGVGGDGDWDIDTTLFDLNGSYGLDPTVGFGVRGELPIHDYIVIGGMFELLTFEADGFSNDEREAVFNIDAWVKGRYPIEINESIVLEPYLGFPIGLTLGVFNQSDGSGDDTWPGFNTGVLAGAMLIFSSHFGAFFELGWRHHQVWHDENNAEAHISANQLALHFGGAYQF